ncbi:hypothetical protein D3C87_140240 [compost metagenome]
MNIQSRRSVHQTGIKDIRISGVSGGIFCSNKWKKCQSKLKIRRIKPLIYQAKVYVSDCLLEVWANRKMPARIVNTTIDPVLQWFKFDQ